MSISFASTTTSKKRLFADTMEGNGTANASVHHNGGSNSGPISPLKRNSIYRTVTLDTKAISAGSKTFNDPIHKHIKLEGLCLRIVDTYQFQRLHSLKQLGVCDYVFRGATHSRFTHSLGVAHLAEKLARALMTRQPELGLTEVDIACIKVAGWRVLNYLLP
jgi:hypothetical protein